MVRKVAGQLPGNRLNIHGFRKAVGVQRFDATIGQPALGRRRAVFVRFEKSQQEFLVIALDETGAGVVVQGLDHQIEALPAFRPAIDDVAEENNACLTRVHVGVDGRKQCSQQIASAVNIADGIGECHAGVLVVSILAYDMGAGRIRHDQRNDRNPSMKTKHLTASRDPCCSQKEPLAARIGWSVLGVHGKSLYQKGSIGLNKSRSSGTYGLDRRIWRLAAPALIKTKDEFSLKKQVRTTFTDRRQDAMEAKQKLLEKMKAAPKADDPEVVAKRAEREAVAKAREIRRAERERLKLEEEERKAVQDAADAAAAYEAAHAEEIAREAEEKARAERAVADMAAMKEKRDKRYAARKARG